MVANLLTYLQYPFVRYALIVGVLIALCSAPLGVTLVLRRFSLLGDGLSHVAFGALAIAAVLKLTMPLPLVLLLTILAAVLLLAGGSRQKVKGDAATAVISVGALSLGYLMMSVFKSSSNLSGDVCTTLFGSTSILTLQLNEVILCAVLSLLVLLLCVFFHDRIFAITFDEEFARASGLHARLYNFAIAVVVAIVVVLAMNLVGALLVSALIVLPALSAMRLFGGYRAVVVTSSIISVGGAFLGIFSAIICETPVGPTVVAVNLLIYAATFVIGKILKA